MPEKSERKSPWLFLLENIVGTFFFGMVIALALDDPQHECFFAALKYTAGIYLFTWTYKILRWLFMLIVMQFYPSRALFYRFYLRALFTTYLRRVKKFFAR